MALEPNLIDLEREQDRLRQEIERLKKEQHRLQEQQSSDGAQGGKNQNGDQKDKKKDDDEKKEEPPKPPLRTRAHEWIATHPWTTVGGIVALVVIVIAGVLLWRYLESYESTDDAEVDGHTDQISSRIAGVVTHVYVENAQSVRAGEVLVDLDPADYRVALGQAQANYAAALTGSRQQSRNVPITETSQTTEVSVRDLDVATQEAALGQAEQNLDAAQAELEQAQAASTNASAEERRYAALAKELEISREMYDRRVTDARSAAAAVRSREAALEAARRSVEQQRSVVNRQKELAAETHANSQLQIAMQRDQLDSRKASAKQAEESLKQALLNLSYCKIVAPADGIIGNRSVEAGMHVAPGEEMFGLTQVNDLWVTANYKETQIREMHSGQGVTIHVDALSRNFDGYVENLPGATGAVYSLLPPENATGNYVKVVQRLPVRIRFKPGQAGADRLRPGMSVEPKVWIH